MNTLNDAVVELHNIARQVEKEIGRGLLSEDIRDCADRLNKLVSYNYIKKEDKENGI